MGNFPGKKTATDFKFFLLKFLSQNYLWVPNVFFLSISHLTFIFLTFYFSILILLFLEISSRIKLSLCRKWIRFLLDQFRISFIKCVCDPCVFVCLFVPVYTTTSYKWQEEKNFSVCMFELNPNEKKKERKKEEN